MMTRQWYRNDKTGGSTCYSKKTVFSPKNADPARGSPKNADRLNMGGGGGRSRRSHFWSGEATSSVFVKVRPNKDIFGPTIRAGLKMYP